MLFVLLRKWLITHPSSSAYGFSVYFVCCSGVISFCNANAFDICALNYYLFTSRKMVLKQYVCIV